MLSLTRTFNHSNILTFKDKEGNAFRGDLFENVSHMNEVIIDKWNKVISPQDKVYHLGDVFMGRRDEADGLLSRLNGKKRLILGNHDTVYGTKGNPLQHHFQKIHLWRVFTEFGLILSHVPVHASTLNRGAKSPDKVMINVHGHIHQNKSPDGPYKCVCVEQTDYAPVNIEELRQW